MTIITELHLEWIVSALGVTTAFGIGLWQYVRAQRQEKVALLLPLINEFETDPELQAACHLFDYDEGSFTLNGQEHQFSAADIREAMKIVWEEQWPPNQEAIREVFDRYFDFFGKLESFVAVRLLKLKELRYFYYYLELLVRVEEYKGDGAEAALDRYLDAYGFHGCRKLLHDYRRLPRKQRVDIKLLGPDGTRARGT